MRVCNPDRSPVGINRCDTTATPTGFAEIVSDRSKRFRFLNAEYFGTILAVQPFIAFPSEGQEIDCKMQSNNSWAAIIMP
jgi:hypothetical protein